jgi:amidase
LKTIILKAQRYEEMRLALTATQLFEQSATQLRQLISSREVSATEVLRAHLTRIEDVNSHLNAIVTLVAEPALAQAATLDQKLARGEDIGILGGIPVGHKDLALTKGIRTTFGSRLYENYVPDENALIVQRMQDAGAITIGKTNTPEWGAGSQTFNEVFGSTKNPYDLSKTCGGSSGGAAVSLASRMLPLCDGSDMGGSLRNPASFCNVVGLRPSAGRVPSVPSEAGWFNLPTSGPMARTVEDCALLMAAIAGPDPRAPLSIQESGQAYLKPLDRDFKNVRVALSSDFDGQIPVQSEVRNIIDKAAQPLTDIGCRIDNHCPDFSGADTAFKTLRAWSFAMRFGDDIAHRRDFYKDTIIWNAEAGLALTGKDMGAAEKARTQLFNRFSELFRNYEFLLLPVVQVAPFSIDDEYVKDIDGVIMETYIDWMKSCYYLSPLGLPAISIPCGFTRHGLPVGLQIIGGPQQDLAVLQLAYAFQQANPAWKTQPDISPLVA